MAKIIEYAVAFSQGVRDGHDSTARERLELRVNQLIDLGWQPYNGIAVGPRGTLYQPMVRYGGQGEQ